MAVPFGRDASKFSIGFSEKFKPGDLTVPRNANLSSVLYIYVYVYIILISSFTQTPIELIK